MPSRKNVLVVEDDPELNELVGAYVEIAGYRYDRALGGNEALRRARDRSPSLILLDIMLPDLDGFEVCRRLKTDLTTRAIPVVMLTALDREEHRRQGIQCGAQGYIVKPFDPDQLIDTIRANANGQHRGKDAAGR
jgi:DNA-binding response OmpR family regulator